MSMIVVPLGVSIYVDGKKRLAVGTHSKPRETAWSRSGALSGLRKDTEPDGPNRGRASQFDPTIDKEIRLISNLRWNMPVFVQTVPNMQLSGR